MNTYITFSGAKYHPWTKRIVEDAPKLGADCVLVYDDHWITTKRPEFCKEHEALFKKRDLKGNLRGFGWFIWKPFILLDALRRSEDGDVVLYTDGDCYPIADLNPLFNQCRKDGGIMLFAANGWTQRLWCKRDAMHLMGQDSEYFRDQQHAVARFMLFQKGAKINFKPTVFYPEGGTVTTEEFLETWLKYTADIRINTFDHSTILPEFPDFRESRCEQSVLTNLAHRYGFKLYREACEFGNKYPEDWDIYPQTFVQNGSHVVDPTYRGQGSRWRNVND